MGSSPMRVTDLQEKGFPLRKAFFRFFRDDSHADLAFPSAADFQFADDADFFGLTIFYIPQIPKT